MSEQTYQKGEKVVVDCLTEQLRKLNIQDLLPGDSVYIINLDYTDDGIEYYQVSENSKSKYGYIIPENFLNKK